MVDNIEVALLPDGHPDIVYINRLGHGWAYQKISSWLQKWLWLAASLGAEADLHVPKRSA